jgi:hypothetical protein
MTRILAAAALALGILSTAPVQADEIVITSEGCLLASLVPNHQGTVYPTMRDCLLALYHQAPAAAPAPGAAPTQLPPPFRVVAPKYLPQAPDTSGVQLIKAVVVPPEDLAGYRRLCSEKWTKRGELDQEMFNYCVGNNREGYEKLVAEVTKYND